jgi:molybdenum ABC transporter molybdate-binding protein
MRLGFWSILLGSAAVVAVLVWLLRPPAPAGDSGETLIVYCAAGMREPVQEIAAAYTAEYGVKIELEFEGSGSLLSKIRGAPDRGHLFLAADASYIEEARRFDLVAEALPIATLTPVLAVPRGNPKQVRGLADLLRPEVKVATANPKLASIGKTVETVLTKTGDWEKLAARAKGASAGVSFVGTVNEVAQAIKLGAADAGFVWESIARIFELEVVPVEALAAAKQTMTIAVLERSRLPTASLRFARYLSSSDQGGPIFRRHRFDPLSDADEWSGPTPEIPVMIGAMLKPGVEEGIRAFEQREGVQITPVYNGCGLLVSQMKAGQPAEMYFSCDRAYMEMVRERFEPAIEISRNRVVLAVPRGNPKELKSLEDLGRGGLKLGFAHPVNSALGKLTDDLLRRLGLHEGVYAANTVIHTDAGHMLVNQLRAGSLDAAVVYRSNVQSAPEASEQIETIPLTADGAVAVQPVAVSRESRHRYLLRRLLDTLTSDVSAQRFKDHGFEWLAPTPGKK